MTTHACPVCGDVHPRTEDGVLRQLLVGVEAAYAEHRNGRLGPTGVSVVFMDIEHGLRGVLADYARLASPADQSEAVS